MSKSKGKKDVKKLHYNLGAALDEKKKIEILSEAFQRRVGYPLNLENPKTMNEKIMWMKLYYQNPAITQCADKFTVKDYVTEHVGAQYTVPTITSWSDPDEIDLEKLPDQFVLKVNWSSGYYIIVRDKSTFDLESAKVKLRKWLKPDRNSYYQYFNWAYKYMKPAIYAEEFLDTGDTQPDDFKFYCCNGEPQFALVVAGRGTENQTRSFVDMDWNVLPVGRPGLESSQNATKPQLLDEMIRVSRELSAKFPFVRVDFYEVNGRIYVGEMTFYPGGGLLPFDPPEWDTIFGEKITLPPKMITDKENLTFKLKGTIKQMELKCKNAVRKFKRKLKKLRRALVHKAIIRKKKYLVILGMRLPYETHTEISGGYRKKYIDILGMQFCYKKTEKKLKKKSNQNLAAQNAQNVGAATKQLTAKNAVKKKKKTPKNTNMKFEYVRNLPLNNYMMEGSKITPAMQRIHCEQKAYKQMGYFPNLKNPQTLNEKIIWLALNYKNPEIAVASDKGKAKAWISQRVGAEYVIPMLGVYEDVSDIDFDALPDRFVAKLNDGWGADKVMIIRDKSQLNVDKTRAILSSWLYPWNNYYYQNMCITDCKMEVPTIMIEEFLDTGDALPNDYKFYCCNGEPQFALVVAGRGGKSQTRSFVDMDWNVLPFARKGMKIAEEAFKPECVELMKELSRKLSKGFPFVRVDFYEVDGKVYVGETTFTPGMFLSFTSKEWDRKLGDYLELPMDSAKTMEENKNA